MSTLKIKKGDTVKVIAGRDKDKEGKVLSVNAKNHTALVEGVNMVTKHAKPSAANQQGGILHQEAPIDISNIMYVVKGKPAWAGQACTMFINSCGKFAKVKHVYTGEKGTDSRGCYVTATRISDGIQVNGVEVTIAMAKAEGWTANTKWRNMPELMLAYRASAFFARVHCPEALMGVQLVDEIYDTETSRNAKKTSTLTAALKEDTINA